MKSLPLSHKDASELKILAHFAPLRELKKGSYSDQGAGPGKDVKQ